VPRDLEMGSDDGKKRRVDATRQAWLLAGVVLLSVISVWTRLQYRARVRLRESGRVLAERPPPTASPTARRGGRLKAELLALASLDADEAMAALGRDPLGIESVENASDWRCPAERVSSVEPSVEAERGVRASSAGYFVWFEHLSKAGGTSFCEFARKNVGRRKTPNYYCMPSDGAKFEGTDGRVGRWDAARVSEYVGRTGHAVVANEWDAFPATHLLDSDLLRNRVVLATVVRDPVDRLVSAYKFWGKLHNPNPNPKPAPAWLRDRDRYARRHPHRLFPNDFLSQVARNNFAVWKFAAAARPDLHDCARNASCDREALEIALDRIERFHVAVPMLWQDAAPTLYRRLGWTHTDQVHKVPSGQIQNSDAHLELGPDFAEFQRNNLYDYIFWAFLRRLFLERVHCPRQNPAA